MDRKSRLQASIKEALPQRKSAEEVERENFQKSQLQSITKAINNMESPVKEKHVRATILGTYTDKGASLFWAYVRKLPLQGNAILCWKFCHVLHKLLREGHPNVLQDSYRHVHFLRDIGKLWGHLKQSYGKLIATYIKLLLQKLHFHKRNPQFPGNLVVPSDEHLYRLAEYDVNAYFQMAIEFLDYTDEILTLQSSVFGSLDMSRSNSMTPTGQCRIAPLIPCIQDSTQLYDFTVKLLFKLHAGLPADTLSGHRDRFLSQFKALKQFFYSSGNLQYFKTLIQVPSLSELPPNFLLQTGDEHQPKHVTPVVVILPEPVDDTAEPEIGELIDTRVPTTDTDIFGASADFSLQGSPEIKNGHATDTAAAAAAEEAAALREREREEVMEQLTNRIKELEFELESLRAAHADVIQTLNQKISQLEETVGDSKAALNLALTENAELKSALEQMPSDTEEIQKRLEAEKVATQSEDKFKKMKDVYGKLREEHIQLLRTDSEKKKQLTQLNEKLEQTEKARHELEERMLRTQADHIIMEKKLSTADFSRVEALEKNLKDAVKKRDSMEKKLKEVMNNQGDLQQSKTNLEIQVEQLSKEADDAKESLKIYDSERTDLIAAKDNALQDLDLARRNQTELSLAKDDLHKRLGESRAAAEESEAAKTAALAAKEAAEVGQQHAMQELDSAMETLLDVENKHVEFQGSLAPKMLDAASQQMVAMITSALDEWENPLFAQVSCSAEYLLLQLESFQKDIFAHIQFLVQMLSQDSPSNEEEIVEEITNTIPVLGHHLSHVLMTTQATSHRAPEVEKGERLSSCAHGAGEKALQLAKLLKGSQWKDAVGVMSAIECNLNSIKDIGFELQPRIADVRAEELGSLVEQELQSLSSIVEMASNRIAEMLEKSKETQTGVKLEVNENILESCTSLMAAIKILITKSKNLQNEIVLAGRGTASPNEFYQKNGRWTEGLLSAAKAVGMGAGVLVDAADAVVAGGGKFEELVVCSQEVAASTVQLVVASKVKASPESSNLKQLQEASRVVHHATAKVVGTAKSGAQKIEEKNLEALDFSKVTLHQAKRLEMDSQVRVLELETNLEKEREHLASLRRKHYQLAGGGGGDAGENGVE